MFCVLQWWPVKRNHKRRHRMTQGKPISLYSRCQKQDAQTPHRPCGKTPASSRRQKWLERRVQTLTFVRLSAAKGKAGPGQPFRLASLNNFTGAKLWEQSLGAWFLALDGSEEYCLLGWGQWRQYGCGPGSTCQWYSRTSPQDDSKNWPALNRAASQAEQHHNTLEH